MTDICTNLYLLQSHYKNIQKLSKVMGTPYLCWVSCHLRNVIHNLQTGLVQCFIHGAGPGKAFVAQLLRSQNAVKYWALQSFVGDLQLRAADVLDSFL